MRGHTTDLPDQLAFIDQHQLRLKLLDLYWTEESAAEYDRYYITPEEALEESVASGYLKLIQDDGQQRGRSRVRYWTPRQGLVEYKLKSTARKATMCAICAQKNRTALRAMGLLQGVPGREVVVVLFAPGPGV